MIRGINGKIDCYHSTSKTEVAGSGGATVSNETRNFRDHKKSWSVHRDSPLDSSHSCFTIFFPTRKSLLNEIRTGEELKGLWLNLIWILCDTREVDYFGICI